MLIAAVFRNRPWIGEMVVFVTKQAPTSLFGGFHAGVLVSADDVEFCAGVAPPGPACT